MIPFDWTTIIHQIICEIILNTASIESGSDSIVEPKNVFFAFLIF
jgi:hypothetical protein